MLSPFAKQPTKCVDVPLSGDALHGQAAGLRLPENRMSTEENRATALKLVATLGAGMPDLSLMTEDAIWWAPGQRTYSNAEFVGIASAFAGMFKAPSTITVQGVTAEGDRVAIEAQGHAELTNGKVYNNRYHYLFIFRAGKICEARLYNDTAHAASMRD
jgi:ketosteroid isomerase-like protein